MNDEQWLCLLKEVQALAKAGLPLDAGLRALAQDARGALAIRSQQLVDAVQAGRPLEDALRSLGGRSAPAYAATVEAGVRSGKLASVLEALVESAAADRELKHRITLALVYPATVLVVALFLLILMAMTFAPSAAAFLRDSRTGDERFAGLLEAVGDTGSSLGLLRPLIGLALFALVAGILPFWLMRWLRGIRTWPSLARRARFTQLLGQMIDCQVPLPSALRLAANAAGAPKERRAAGKLADAIEHGAEAKADDLSGMPASLCLLLAGHCESATLGTALRRLAGDDRERLEDIVSKTRTRLPAAMLICVAGSAVLLYGLLEFVPLARLLRGISDAN